MVIPFGKTNFRGQERMFGIKEDDRRRHIYIIGKTGMGKSELLKNMTIADIEAGHGVAVIDPHGEYAEDLLDYIPSNRVNDVIYFNPADLDYPIAFNVIEQVAPENRHLIASGLMGVFKKIWPDVWSARMEYILNNTILALLEYPNSTLLGIMRMLANKEYRQKVLEKVSDPVIKSFWLQEYSQYSEKFEKEAIAPIQNKVGQFISAAVIRNIIGQTKSSIDMREVMDSQKILIINLSKGKIGEDNSKLLGGMLVTKLQLAAMGRVDIPESERKDFYLYVDEFQNFATDSFADILSEARKYRLNLILGHQYVAQISEKVRDAVFGNVGTLIAFRVGADDAEFLEKEFSPDFMASDLVNLGKYNIYLKLIIDGMASKPFSAVTLPPRPKPPKSYKETIIRLSRERYAKNKKEVEEKISRWTGVLKQNMKGGQQGPPQGQNFSRPRPQPRNFEPNRPQRPPLPVAPKSFVAPPNPKPAALPNKPFPGKKEMSPRPAPSPKPNLPQAKNVPNLPKAVTPARSSANTLPQKAISLKEALLRKDPVSFGNKPIKKEVNREALKKLLEESLDELEKDKKENNRGVEKKEEESLKLAEDKNTNQVIVKPGQKIFFGNKKRG